MKRVLFLKLILLTLFLFPFLSVDSQQTNLINYFWLNDRTLVVSAGEIYPDQVVAINTEKGIVIIDSGISPTLSKEYRKIIEREFRRDGFAYLINTHHHFDHTNGNQVFRDAIIIGHNNCPEQMYTFSKNLDDFVKARKERVERRSKVLMTLDTTGLLYKRFRDLVYTSGMMCYDLENNYVVTPPTLTFTDELIIDQGDITLKLIHFPPGLHTDNDVIAMIPEVGLVFTGDLIYDYETFSNITSNSNLEAWIKTLNKILTDTFEIKEIVTIHSGILLPDRLISYRDGLINMAVEKQEKENAVRKLEMLINANGLRVGIEEFKAFYSKNKNNFYLWEGDLIELASKYSTENKYKEAQLVFQLNTEMYPESVDAYDWFGEACYLADEKEPALKAFEKALELNPLDSYAMDMIWKINNEE